MMENLKMANKSDTEFLHFLMEENMMENLKMRNLTETEFLHGLMEINLMENGIEYIN